MASELTGNVKKAAVTGLVKVATLTNADYDRLKRYWKEELGYKLGQIERELGIEDRNTLSTEEYDELIEDYIASGNPIVRLYDRETKEPKDEGNNMLII